MKNKTVPYPKEGDLVYTTPSEERVWLRTPSSVKERRVIRSECRIGDYILTLSLFCSVPEPWQTLCIEGSLSREESDKIWNKHLFFGYNFFVRSLKHKVIYMCGFDNDCWFDTTDINEAERVAEYVFRKMKV